MSLLWGSVIVLLVDGATHCKGVAKGQTEGGGSVRDEAHHFGPDSDGDYGGIVGSNGSPGPG
jgi:hypothetical protein